MRGVCVCVFSYVSSTSDFLTSLDNPALESFQYKI